MSTLSLTIVQPVHNSVFNDADANVPLQANLSGSSVGLYFKWYSSLNSAATAEKPELNGDHSSAALNMTAPLQAFGSHVITLAAADQEGADMGSIAAITRSGMAGGAPPAAAAPCVIHRLKAQIRMPASNGQSLSRANSTLEVLAPQPLAKLDPTSGTWVRDQNYLQINGISMRLRLPPPGCRRSGADGGDPAAPGLHDIFSRRRQNLAAPQRPSARQSAERQLCAQSDRQRRQ